MARNAKSPTVPSQSQTTALSQCNAIPEIRIERSSKDEPLIEIIQMAPPKPTPPPRNLLLATPNRRTMNGSTRVSRQPRQTSIRNHANGNGVMKSGPKETVINFGFTEDPIPPSHYCCEKVRIQSVCRFVGMVSFIGFIINLVLYFMGISKLGLNGYLEAFLLIFDFIAVMMLLCGVSKKRSSMLKPYLVYNTVWSLGLIILFLVFIWHMFKGTHDISRNILENLRALRSTSDEYQYRSPYTSTTAILVTLLVMGAMATVIIIDCIFLHIVYRTFSFFSYDEDKRREEMDKKERL